jgi:hypothetical protein
MSEYPKGSLRGVRSGAAVPRKKEAARVIIDFAEVKARSFTLHELTVSDHRASCRHVQVAKAAHSTGILIVQIVP